MSTSVRALNRIGPGVASQGLNSVGNLALVAMVARLSGSDAFGAWTLVYTVYGAVLALSRTVVSTPMMIAEHGVATDVDDERGSASSAIGIGVAIGLILVVISLFTSGTFAWSCMIFGLFMPLLLAQDALRYVFLQQRRENRAALIDLVWLILQVLGFVAIAIDNPTWVTPPAAATLVWAVGGLCSTLTGFVLWRRRVGVDAAWSYAQRHRKAAGRLSIDAGLAGVSGAVLPFFLASFVGLSAAGALRAGTTLMGAVALLVMALTPLATVEAARRFQSGQDLGGLLRVWILAIGTSGMAYGTALLFLPDSVGKSLLGSSWVGAHSILVPLIAQAIVRGPFTGVPIMLRAQRRLDEVVTLRLRATVANIALPLLGATIAGLQGAAWGLFTATLINNMQSWTVIRRPHPGGTSRASAR